MSETSAGQVRSQDTKSQMNSIITNIDTDYDQKYKSKEAEKAWFNLGVSNNSAGGQVSKNNISNKQLKYKCKM